MIDVENFKYTITRFDEEHRIIVVSFDDGGWADIRLNAPLPKNMDELESVIRNFTPSYEHMQAIQSTEDLSFISSNVGMERTAARLKITAPQTITTENSDNSLNFDAVEAAEIERLKGLIREVLHTVTPELINMATVTV